jgi:hypothetical protein
MSFVNASVLLFGSLLVAAPIVLHLMMRRKPKQLVFPALRFVKARREQNQHRLRLRQLLLLALRCLAIVLLAAALARPSVDSSTLGDWLLTLLLATLFLFAGLGAVLAFMNGRSNLLGAALSAVAAQLLIGAAVMGRSAWNASSQFGIGDEEAPLAAALIVDSAPRMAYRHENRTRLEQAKETALWVLPQLPAESEVAVIDARPGPAAFSVDRAAAQRAVERLEPSAIARPLTETIADALTLVRSSDKARKEIFIFTDQTETAWRDADASRLRDLLSQAPEVQLYVFDVGVENPQNVALGELQLSAERLTSGSQLEVAVDVVSVGSMGARDVELYLESPDATVPLVQEGRLLAPPALPRQRLTVAWTEASGNATSGGNASLPSEPSTSQKRAQRLRFAPLPKLPPGVHHGYVRLVGEDALAWDNERYFTVEVRSPWPVLVVSPPSADPSYFTEALAPYEFRVTGQARFACEAITQDELRNAALNQFAAVCLLDPLPLTPDQWSKLADFAAQGGGVALFLGRNAQNYSAWNEPPAQAVLPGKIVAPFIWNAPQGNLFLVPGSAEHPVLAPFRALATVAPWQNFPVYKHWVMTATSPDSAVIARYGNNKPALLERLLGRGRVIVMTTPVSDSLNQPGREPWNNLPTGFDPWPFVILANETASHLVGARAARLNYLTGETAELANDEQEDPARYELYPPTGDPREATAHGGAVTLRFLDEPGAYRLLGQRGGAVVRGFSANLPLAATDLTRAPPERLDSALGEDRYQLARTRDDFRRKIGLARQGREFYPFLLVMLAVVMGMEYLLANRFYKAE